MGSVYLIWHLETRRNTVEMKSVIQVLVLAFPNAETLKSRDGFDGRDAAINV